MGPTYEFEVKVKYSFDAESMRTAFDVVNMSMEKACDRIMKRANMVNPPPSFMRVCYEITDNRMAEN